MRRITTVEDEADYADPVRDLPKIYEIKLKNNSVRIEKFGPYGHYRVSYDKGNTPNALRGSFLTLADAKQAIRNYLQFDGRLYQAEGQL